MTERIDHVAEAKVCMESAHTTALPYESDEAQYLGLIAEAQVHATLALVEQQRIANIIALGKYTHADGSRGFQHVVTHPTDEYSLVLNDDIREGLGL